MNHQSATGDYSSFQSGLDSVRENWGWILASGIAFFVFGVIALSYSVLVTMASVLVLGWVLIFGGILQSVHAFKIVRWSGFLLELLACILYVVVGALMVLNPGASAVSLTLLMAAFFLVSGVFRILTAATLQPPSWGWLLISGMVTFLLGILIWAEWPVSSLWVIGLFIGIDMIVSGNACLGSAEAAASQSSRCGDDLGRSDRRRYEHDVTG